MRALIPCLVVLAACGKLFDIDRIAYNAPDAAPPAVDAAPDTPPTAAKLQAGAPSYDFGDITLGHASFAIAVDISNVGNAATGTLSLAKSDDAADFTVGTDDCSGHSLAAGGACRMMITFSPSAAGAKTSTLTVADGATSAATTLTGSALTPGALDISPSLVDFGAAKIGHATSSVTVTLQNTGETPITVTSLALSDTATFTYDASACTLPKSLAAHATCAVTLAFSPHLGGSHVASLTATTDANANNMTSVSLGGTGTATVTITKSGGTAMITSSDGAISCPSTCTATFSTPTVTLTAAPDTYNNFGSWSSNCKPADAPTCSVATSSGEIGVAAAIVAWPTLSLRVTGASGSVSGWGGNCQSGNTCTSRQPPGTTLTLTPGGPNAFNLWTGPDCSGQSPACTFQMTADATDTADFTSDYAVNIIDHSTGVDAAAGVTVSPADRNGNSYCASGNTCTFHYTDPVPLTLTGSSGACAQFTQFTGACTDNPCMLTPATMSTTLDAYYTGVTATGC